MIHTRFLKRFSWIAATIALLLGMTQGANAQAAREAFIAELNAYRAENGLQPVVFDQRLYRAARDHNTDMRRNNFFSHTGSNGSSLSDRVTAQGFTWCAVAENIAKGQTTPASVFSSWQNSDGHNKNMLNARVDSVGIQYQPNGRYWTLVLAQDCG